MFVSFKEIVPHRNRILIFLKKFVGITKDWLEKYKEYLLADGRDVDFGEHKTRLTVGTCFYIETRWQCFHCC